MHARRVLARVLRERPRAGVYTLLRPLTTAAVAAPAAAHGAWLRFPPGAPRAASHTRRSHAWLQARDDAAERDRGMGMAPAAEERWRVGLGLGAAAGVGFAAASVCEARAEDDVEVISNWSNTHQCTPQAYHQPETLEALEALVHAAHTAGTRLRPIGSALSPNGVGFSDAELVNLALMDQVVEVDAHRRQVRVQAGARVSQVTEALRPHGLVLQNFASIAEQQVGGFIQVGAHGTGAGIPPVDEMVVSMKLVTPAMGTLELSADKQPELFSLAKVALGSLGVVAEVTLQCVPAHRLVERTWVATRQEVVANHAQLLREYQHIRFMWIPYTDDVVVVGSNPLQPEEDAEKLRKSVKQMSEYNKVAPLRELLKQVAPAYNTWRRRSELNTMNFAQLRDALLAADPLNVAHVKRVNAAEAAFWRNNQGIRVDWSDRILGFECGGEQWVSEVAFPSGSMERPGKADMSFMRELLQLIEREGVPAPAPIEQRWTAGSSASLSIAADPDPDSVHSWVGIIMYLPTSEPTERARITQEFTRYKQLCMDQLWGAYGACEHWAKVELSDCPERRAQLTERLRARFPDALAAAAAARVKLDPRNVLGNTLVDAVLPRGPPPLLGSLRSLLGF